MHPKFVDCDPTKLCFELLFKETEKFLLNENDYNEFFSKFKQHYNIEIETHEQELVADFIRTLEEIVYTVIVSTF